MTEFEREVELRLAANAANSDLREISLQFMRETTLPKYSYNYFWLGRPIIQYPQDIVAMQELIWKIKPDLIIETGIAHGGSLILSASMLALLDYCEALEKGAHLDPQAPQRRVLGLDIDIRKHNRSAIEAHPMSNRIDMIEGSSLDPEVVTRVHKIAQEYENVLVCLDSNHTHDHVLAELEAYAPLVTEGSYCVVFDTVLEDIPGELFPDRPWGPGNNPKTAVHAYLKDNKNFEIDKRIDDKLLISVAPNGYLRRVK